MVENSLVEDIISGDEHAFRKLVEANVTMIMRVIMSFGITREDAEDLSQDVFIDVYNNIRKFRKESELSTWLYRIAINKSINFARKNKSNQWVNRSNDEIFVDDNDIIVGSTEDNLLIEERRKILYNSIRKLPKNQRIAFTLNKLDDFSYKDISRVMKVSLSSVESLLHRAKKNLQKDLMEYFK